MNSLWQDLKYAARTLRARPAFTAAVVLSLALGIGACTAIYSVVDAVLLRPLPYAGADKIVNLKEVDDKGRRTSFAEPNFLDVRARNHTLSEIAEYNMGVTTVLGGSEPVRTQVAFVSRDFFKTLSVEPATGRSFLPEETMVGGNPAAIVSYGYWQRLLSSRSDLAATPLRIGDTSYTVVGVMPRRFNFPKDAEIWLPFELYPPAKSRRSHGRITWGLLVDQGAVPFVVWDKHARRSDLYGGNTIARGRGAAGLLPAGAPRNESRSVGGAPIRVEKS